jgi:hypothetical protein
MYDNMTPIKLPDTALEGDLAKGLDGKPYVFYLSAWRDANDLSKTVWICDDLYAK